MAKLLLLLLGKKTSHRIVLMVLACPSSTLLATVAERGDNSTSRLPTKVSGAKRQATLALNDTFNPPVAKLC